MRFSSNQNAISRTFAFLVTLLMFATILLPVSNVFADDKEEDGSGEKSLAAYADAANFQTNGALDLAIEAWEKYLKEYADDPMASKAAHYLGVCYMQQENPDYVAASNAFRKALRDSDYDLREESLINHGWSLYAAAGEPPNRNMKRLRESLETLEALRKEFPKSRFADRAIFYSGEAAYALGETKQAIAHYDKLLALPNAKDSPLRCDALYARGVAYEELKQIDKAVSSFRQLLSSCADSELVTDVHLRMGDAAILYKHFDKAIESFDAAIKSTESEEDISYALFRQAFAMVQAERPVDAAKKYEQLLREHPKSRYAATARLASAQSAYRGGEMKIAEKRFREVLNQDNIAAATEAAHWLVRMELSKGRPAEAAEIAKNRIDDAIEGDFATALRLDYAEALSMDAKSVKRSADLFEEIYRDGPRDPLASRSLYNAAFSALQANEGKRALSLSSEFTRKFTKDTLLPDVMYIAAEASLMTGNPQKAAETYQNLLKTSESKDNVQRPLWVLRAAATSNAARTFSDTISLLRKELQSLKEPAQVAEAQMMLGQAFLMSKKPADAAMAFDASSKADPKWPRADEAQILAGQALMAAGKKDQARRSWQSVIRKAPKTRMADQARYKLAQAESSSGNYANAVKYYDQIISSRKDPALMPYAKYGRGWSLMQDEKYDQALKALDSLLKEDEKHPVAADALLARGITRRNLEQWRDSKSDLEAFLKRNPKGQNLGHALYELALIDQQQSKPEQAAKRLERLVKEVPNYPGMDKVLYELGWSLREAGMEDDAEARFAELTTKFPKTKMSAEASFFVGQKNYSEEKWIEASKHFALAAKMAEDKELSEKSLYRLGWSHFKSGKFEQSGNAFRDQAKKHANGKLAIDALMMIGECHFKENDFDAALSAYQVARQRIRSSNDTAKTIRDQAERQVRELILLHGGQSAAQQKKWKAAIEWYDELSTRFPATVYLPQAFYEKGFAYQQLGDPNRAVKFFAQVANNYRNEVAARSRFMMGEIYFGNRQFADAIPEFQRVMFGYGAEKAPDAIKNWQAKSGFEAGRCSELLMQQAATAAAKAKSKKYAQDFFNYVIDRHPGHELAAKSRERLEALAKL